MSTTAGSADTIYLDYAATTPLDTAVQEVMLPYFSPRYGNPSSLYASGRRAHGAIATAREKVAGVLGCAPSEIIFTGSGTESDNLALVGAARANRARGNHIIISAIEHKAVIESARMLERDGFVVSILPVDRYGMISVDECMRLVTSQTTLVSVMYANNEIGTIEPIQALATAIKERRGASGFPLLHTDACQAAGFLPLGVDALGVDLMTLNSSKIYGPKGVGMLYKRSGVPLEPIVVGGEQEWGMRAGTESVPLIVGFAEALILAEELRETESARLTELRDYFIEELQKRIPHIVINGHPNIRLPNNIHISIPFIEGESILLMLDHLGIEASTGSACSAHDLKPSHVLLAIGQSAELAHGSVRFSLGRSTTKKDLDYVLSIFPDIIDRLCAISSLNTNIVTATQA